MTDVKLLKRLREETGASFADCKEALIESNNSYEKALEIVKKKKKEREQNEEGKEIKKEQYKIVSAWHKTHQTALKMLAEDVERLMRSGWIPQGGPFIIDGQIPEFFQALIKK